MTDGIDSLLTPVLAAARESVAIGERITVLPLDETLAAGLIVRSSGNGSAAFADDVQIAIEARLPAPRRRQGSVTVTELDAFVATVNRWKRPAQTTVWADLGRCTLTAVLDDHPAGAAGAAWRLDRVLYTAPPSPEWIRWSERADRDLEQEAFATFIDDNLPDVTTIKDAEKGRYPSPLELLEMARNLSIHTRGSFERKLDPTTGTGTLVVKDEHESYSSKIWKAFPLALRVFESGQVYLVEARIRFRVQGGKAIFGYTLHRAAEVKRDAFREMRTLVAGQCEGCPVFAGSP
jgi:hypothetical protein